MRVEHRRTGSTFEAPEGWEVVSPPQPGGESLMVIAIEPEHRDGGFRANLVLTAVPNAGVSYEDWQGASEALLAEQLSDYLLLDRAETVGGAQPRGRRLAHHVAENGDALVMHQWFTVQDDVGVTLTATVDALRFGAVAEELSACGESLDVPQETP